jgi:hypothetical protein
MPTVSREYTPEPQTTDLMIQAATTQITKRATALDVHEVPETRFVAVSLYFASSNGILSAIVAGTTRNLQRWCGFFESV